MICTSNHLSFVGTRSDSAARLLEHLLRSSCAAGGSPLTEMWRARARRREVSQRRIDVWRDAALGQDITKGATVRK